MKNAVAGRWWSWAVAICSREECAFPAARSNAEARYSRGQGYMQGFRHDLKIAFRNIRTKPLFSLMVIGMLTLGVASNAAIFSIFNSLFLHPLPFAESDRLIDLDETAPKWNLKYEGLHTTTTCSRSYGHCRALRWPERHQRRRSEDVGRHLRS
jgi:hypothetical protein